MPSACQPRNVRPQVSRPLPSSFRAAFRRHMHEAHPFRRVPLAQRSVVCRRTRIVGLGIAARADTPQAACMVAERRDELLRVFFLAFLRRRPRFRRQLRVDKARLLPPSTPPLASFSCRCTCRSSFAVSHVRSLRRWSMAGARSRCKRTCTCGGARSCNARRGRGPPRFFETISMPSRRSRSKKREGIDGGSLPLGRTAAQTGRRTGSRTPGRTFLKQEGRVEDLDTKPHVHRDLASKISIGAQGSDAQAYSFDARYRYSPSFESLALAVASRSFGNGLRARGHRVQRFVAKPSTCASMWCVSLTIAEMPTS